MELVLQRHLLGKPVRASFSDTKGQEWERVLLLSLLACAHSGMRMPWRSCGGQRTNFQESVLSFLSGLDKPLRPLIRFAGPRRQLSVSAFALSTSPSSRNLGFPHLLGGADPGGIQPQGASFAHGG